MPCDKLERPFPDWFDKTKRNSTGKQEPCWPVDPYEFLVWWPLWIPSKRHRFAQKAGRKLKASVDITPIALLKAPQQKL